MKPEFLVDTYETEILKVLSVWSMFREEDLPERPKADDARGRSVREQMVHQCVSEEVWFRTIFGLDAGLPPLPSEESRRSFIQHYAACATRRLAALREQPEEWWEQEVAFFEERRSRAWVMVRRIAHTAHHRGQQTAMLRMLGCDLHSTYGPTADTGGLMKDAAPVIYAYADLDAVLDGGEKAVLPGAEGRAVTERPDS